MLSQYLYQIILLEVLVVVRSKYDLKIITNYLIYIRVHPAAPQYSHY
jgi:hypothetical protein